MSVSFAADGGPNGTCVGMTTDTGTPSRTTPSRMAPGDIVLQIGVAMRSLLTGPPAA